MSEKSVSELCNRLMQSFASFQKNSGRKIASLDQACDVMRAELQAFLIGPEYADERECLLRRSIDERAVWASLVASAVGKIQWIGGTQ